MGMMLPMFGIPVLGFALVVWAVASRPLSTGLRWASMATGILLAAGLFATLRTGGITGAGVSDLHWRWTKTPEERLLADGSDRVEPSSGAPSASTSPPATTTTEVAPAGQQSAPPLPPSTARSESRDIAGSASSTAERPKHPDVTSSGTEPKVRSAEAGEEVGEPAGVPAARATARAEWPGFRGAARDSVIHGVQIDTDWSKSPPVQLWRRAIGPGWSSFSVHAGIFYTQEQRGADEIVAAYKVATGEPVWRHRDPARFYESNGGPGPRATPTLGNGRVYAFGATGILNALDARTGALVWSRNVGSDTHIKTPQWGFSSSPLIAGDVVIVAASGALAAYDATTGKPRWSQPSHGASYSSPHQSNIDGVPQIVLLNAAGVTSVSPSTGTVLWQHEWAGGSTIVQPALIGASDILVTTLATTGGMGVRRLSISHSSDKWNVEERWTSTGLKPYFNDLVVHKGHVFGFDGNILSCISLDDGSRKWKGGRYGNGQLVLLQEQDLLLVLSEDGELALVSATPDQFKELARFPALEGKTWNHPVLVGDILLVRNGQEMAAFRLSLAGQS
jgi:outer membrane protein assembly factor BamB